MKRATFFAVIAALGFFALVAQTLLFREFFGAFESNEIAIGAFFSAWLAWICAGAFAGRFETRLHRALASRLPAVALLYVPAFFLQLALLNYARALAGVEAYDVFPLLPMLAMAFVVNAPVSLATGFLFTLACRWAEGRADIPVARVYVLETLGGCAGGLFATAALAGGMPAEGVAVCACALLASAVLAASFAGARLKRAVVVALIAALLVVAGHGGVGRWLADVRARAEWSRLLPADEFEGWFATGHGKYLYGRREGQFNVVSGGGVCETLPPGDHAAEIAAVHLAQRPDARSALVVGDGGLGVCLKLLQLPLIERVAWHHPDPEYPARLMRLLPESLKGLAARVQHLPDDPTFPVGPLHTYDLVILNLPDITTLALNRYVTERYFAELKKIVSLPGAVSVRVSGGENYLGGELVLQGSSLMFTLGRVFKEVTIKPGDETWVMAGDAPFLYSPDGLRKQFAAIPGAAGIYPPENISVLYGAGRVGFQMQAYRKQIDLAGEDILLNTDESPKAPTYALLLAIKQAGLPSFAGVMNTPRSRGLRAALAAALAAAIGLYGLLRAVYLIKSRRGVCVTTFDSLMLVFTTGLAGMALGVVLMFGYQSRYGSLFLDLGLVSALFMLGAFLGGLAAERALVAAPGRVRAAAAVAVAMHVGALVALPYLLGWQSRPVWWAGFLICGALTGLYFPYAAHRLKTAGRTPGRAGSNLELLDNLGGAVGAAVSGLLLLPLLGLAWTGPLLAALVAVNLPGILFGSRQTDAPEETLFDRLVRPAGYTLAGAGAFALIASHAFGAALKPPDLDALRTAALVLAGERPLEAGPDADVSYFTVPGADDKKAGYVFSTKPWAGSLYAFAGTFELAVLADEAGELQAYEVVSSSETPMYLDMVRDADSRLIGRNLFQPDAFAGVDGVVGATSTDEAFREALTLAGHGFARDVLKTQGVQAGPQTQTATAAARDRRNFVLLAAFMAAAIALSYRPRAWARRALLLASVLSLGFWFNLPYSTQQVMSLLTGQPGRVGLNAPFILLAAVPLIALLFGNVYCGYVCPFGALQELASDLGALLRIRLNPGRPGWKCGRAVKYLALFTLVVLYAVRRDLNVLRADPLLAFFGGQTDKLAAGVAFAAVGLSLVFGRFWCRNLCPAGAFLALANGARLNGVRVLRRVAPARLPARCDLGAASPNDFDCLCCDRCRTGRCCTGRVVMEKESNRWHGWALVAAAAVMLVAVAAVTFHEPAPQAAAPAAAITAGQPQDANVDKVRDLIQQGALSDYPADFARPVSESR